MLDSITPTAPVLAPAGVDAASSTGAAGAAGPIARAGGSVAATQGEDFTQVLENLMNDAIGTLKSAEATSIRGVKGQASVQEVVEAVMAAEQTLQAGIAIRDKVVSAYLEVSRMSI